MSSILSRRNLLRVAAAGVPLVTSANRLLAWQESSTDAKYSSDVNVVNVLASVHDKASLNSHVYLIADCKTVGCWVHLVVRHLGQYDPQGSYEVPKTAVLRLNCNVCNAANDFGQHDLKIIRGLKPTNDFRAAF